MTFIFSNVYLLHMFIRDNGRVIFFGLLSLGFFAGGLIFINESFDEFIKGNTGYTEKIEPLKLSDLPTWTLCLTLEQDVKKLIYEEEFLIDVKIFDENEKKTVTLAENRNIGTLFDLQIHLSELRQLKELEDNLKEHDNRVKKCYKITLTQTWTGNETTDLTTFGIQFAIWPNPSLHLWEPTFYKAQMWVTNEANAFGLAFEKWFDAGERTMAEATQPDKYEEPKIGTLVYIPEVTETSNMDSVCSQDSYYVCLAKRFSSLALKNNSESPHDGISCPSHTKCTSVTLPFGSANQIPFCQNDADRACFEKVIRLLEKDQYKYCKKLCKVLNYKIIPESISTKTVLHHEYGRHALVLELPSKVHPIF